MPIKAGLPAKTGGQLHIVRKIIFQIHMPACIISKQSILHKKVANVEEHRNAEGYRKALFWEITTLA
jgi:hypothetical protein